MKEENKGPVAKKEMGRFQVSIWKQRRTVPAGSEFEPEREYDVVRVCIQHSRFNRATREYRRQQIWCNPQELRDLAGVVDDLGNGGNGGDGHE